MEDASSGDVANVMLRLVSGTVSAPSIIRRQVLKGVECTSALLASQATTGPLRKSETN